MLECIQAILNAICLLSYVVLFVWFSMLISKNKERLGSLMCQVTIFFSVMLLMLTLNFVLDLIFYIQYDSEKKKSLDQLKSQEKLVSVCSYMHSGVEIVFNFVLLAFLIA
mmetsp:Transcript_15865/g.19984  ORF Transcript_15865/g.19984 Transcript_15865/m.19984 type:complete len:110 (+) Transcript_15865:542-871(+)